MCFSDQLSLEPPRALVLEAARSLRLFGGAEALLAQVGEGVAALGYHARCVLAPTPAGALMLAAAGVEGPVADGDALRRALARLPIAALGFDRREREDLARMGLLRIGDLLRLPRSGLAERFGDERLRQLERLFGERADPRRPFEPPACFRAELELPAEVPDAGALVFAGRRLLEELGGFLLARQAGVQRLDWRLIHADRDPTRFRLGSARSERDPQRWLSLLRERLERLRLPAPVRAVAVVSEALRPLAPSSGELFADAVAALEPDPALLDRLRARLGDEAVCGLALVADQRPERSWRWCRPGDRSDGLPRRDRPLWLLPEPVALPLRGGRPWLDGPLGLGAVCERIETGWWDGFEVARDYYTATAASGERLWIYREIYGERGWFLQGIFGPDTGVVEP
jgi:protein ImuB